MPRRSDAPKPPFAASFIRGVEHFNALQFWEAHEAWEELWLAAESDVVEFLQGLIQLAAAYHHVRRGTLRGAVRLFDAALERLEPFPDGFCNLNRAVAAEAARRHRQQCEAQLQSGDSGGPARFAYPLLELLSTVDAFTPPRDPW